jgi:putative flippase GtrA
MTDPVVEEVKRRYFWKSVLVSTLTTSADFGLLMLLVEVGHVDYVLATFLGTLLGSTSNFLINRYWAFAATDGHAGGQAMRYFLSQCGSIGLHTGGVWVFTRFLGFRYFVAKVVVAILAYLVWNYPMNKYFVFRRR